MSKRKPDLPCAQCGKLMWRNHRDSLPAGQATCRPCRRSSPTYRRPAAFQRACTVCGTSFYPNDHRDRKQLTCSRKCGAVGRKPPAWPPHPCKVCGLVTARPSTACAACVPDLRAARNQRKNLKRRAVGEPMSVLELAGRDGWRCHLCRHKVGRTLRWPHPRSASRDHLIPVADGGTNEPANLALAHLICNVRRRTGGTVQLALVG